MTAGTNEGIKASELFPQHRGRVGKLGAVEAPAEFDEARGFHR